MTAAVMTSGVAPGASKASQQMSDDQTTLPEFTTDDGVDSAPDCGPTPAENARDIQRLVDLVQKLTDQVGALSGEREQHDQAVYSAEDIDSDPTGMFH